MNEETQVTIKCAVCPMRAKAEANPNSLLSKLWKWHTTWCPGWKAYQKQLAEHQEEAGA